MIQCCYVGQKKMSSLLFNSLHSEVDLSLRNVLQLDHHPPIISLYVYNDFANLMRWPLRSERSISIKISFTYTREIGQLHLYKSLSRGKLQQKDQFKLHDRDNATYTSKMSVICMKVTDYSRTYRFSDVLKSSKALTDGTLAGRPPNPSPLLPSSLRMCCGTP